MVKSITYVGSCAVGIALGQMSVESDPSQMLYNLSDTVQSVPWFPLSIESTGLRRDAIVELEGIGRRSRAARRSSRRSLSYTPQLRGECYTPRMHGQTGRGQTRQKNVLMTRSRYSGEPFRCI